VAKGKSYVHTTRLVDTGVYAIVRHPQMGTAWLLMCVALMLITQHWISVALGIPAMVLTYVDLLKPDQRLIEKFGDAYRRYMERVPRVNCVAGIIRLLAARSAA
jgi:protein-S-isoprenylcysteine O-methyltransferase Ste14